MAKFNFGVVIPENEVIDVAEYKRACHEAAKKCLNPAIKEVLSRFGWLDHFRLVRDDSRVRDGMAVDVTIPESSSDKCYEFEAALKREGVPVAFGYD